MRKFIKTRFEILAEWISSNLGHPYAFLSAAGCVFLWAILGPVFGFSDTWQLVINTGTTIVTFLMVFLLQNTGNRGIDQTQVRLESLEAQNQQLLAELKSINNSLSNPGSRFDHPTIK